MPLALQTLELAIWGCTDGEHTCSCKECKLDRWECHIFKDETKHQFLYAIKGSF